MNKLSTEDVVFQSQMETCELLPSDFTHQAHLRLAYIYLAQNGTESAYKLMRSTLQNFLAQYEVPASKYHETVTKAWILAVRHFMERTGATESAENFIDQNPILHQKILC